MSSKELSELKPSYLQAILQYYPASVYETSPIGCCTLLQMINSIKSPKPEMLTLFKKIEQASKDKDVKLKAELKSKLYYFTPPCTTDGKGRKYENIVRFNGLLILDFDGLTEETAISLKQFLFNEYKFIIASFLSSSKRGVKCIVRIPVVNTVDEFKAYFYGLAVKMQWIIGFDGSSQNCALPNYLTYDRDILFREDADEWVGMGYKEDEFKITEKREPIELENVTEEDRQYIISNLQKAVDKIVDSGHFIIRSVAVTLFGYCGGNYFTEDEVQDILFGMIDNNAYLSQKANVYKRTALDMKLGMNNPLYLAKHEQ